MVAAEVYFFEVPEIAELVGYGAGQLVVEEHQGAEAGQVAKLGRYGAGQVVAREVEAFEVVEFSEGSGNLTAQVVADEVDFSYAAIVVGLDAVPVGERGVGEPVAAVCPVRAAGGVVERVERCQFGADDGQREVACGCAGVCGRFDDVVSGVERYPDAGVSAPEIEDAVIVIVVIVDDVA